MTQLQTASGHAPASPFDVFDNAMATLAAKGETTLLALPGALSDALVALGRVPVTDTSLLVQCLVVASAMLGLHGLARHLGARFWQNALLHPVPIFALFRQLAIDALALVAAAVIGRLLLVHWLGLPVGASQFPVEMAAALVRWLFVLTVLRIFFQPDAPSLRLVRVDDAGARFVMWRARWVLAFGLAHAVLVGAWLRDGVSVEKARALSVLVAMIMMFAGFQTFRQLRAHGLGSMQMTLACCIFAALTGLWIWGAFVGETDLFRGAIGSLSIVILALVLDRVLALSIRTSRRPAVMRRLFVIRALVDAAAVALILRILIEFWLSGVPGLFGSPGWSDFARRFSLASVLVVLGLWLSALIHVWVDARLLPGGNGRTGEENTALRARLATVLPIVRFGAITIIMLVVALMALSIIGVDITPLIAGAGIVGLAISLGSQTLAKDIVSGLFYMFEDVFRLGETIESNGRQGRLEAIGTRSVRLRDETGRVHTIPFGDLGAITNHSRRLMSCRIAVDFHTFVEPEQITTLALAIGHALHSEKPLQAGLVGDIQITSSPLRAEGRDQQICATFQIDAGRAQQADALAKRLVEGELMDAGFSGDKFSITALVLEAAMATKVAVAPA
ncbi:MAG: hypothetical protein CTY25_14500 [Methylobacterium sp.]|nr:MAG: hypothetical protein CTY25_14500 [Methylobacterium sp.]